MRAPKDIRQNIPRPFENKENISSSQPKLAKQSADLTSAQNNRIELETKTKPVSNILQRWCLSHFRGLISFVWLAPMFQYANSLKGTFLFSMIRISVHEALNSGGIVLINENPNYKVCSCDSFWEILNCQNMLRRCVVQPNSSLKRKSSSNIFWRNFFRLNKKQVWYFTNVKLPLDRFTWVVKAFLNLELVLSRLVGRAQQMKFYC